MYQGKPHTLNIHIILARQLKNKKHTLTHRAEEECGGNAKWKKIYLKVKREYIPRTFMHKTRFM